jgi:microsomal dipeptidase-like Zn-dependent dipeptidase
LIVGLHAHYAIHLVPKTAGTPIDLFSTASGRGFEDPLEVIGRHLDRIAEITGSHAHAAIGSDFDGFIKPTMGGLESMTDMARLEQALRDCYGVEDAERICSRNALRVLRAGWRS